jgi:hypothetical protein
MILIALCVVFLLGLMAVGGRVGNLAHIEVKWGWLAPLAFVMQAYLIFFPGEMGGGLLNSRSLILISSYGLLFVVIWYNRQLPGVKLIGLGLLLNFLVIVLNGGFMPITPEALIQIGYDSNAPRLETGYLVARTKNIVMEPGEARLWFLSDILVLPSPFPMPTALSLGDLLIVGGMFFFLRKPMLRKTPASSLA